MSVESQLLVSLQNFQDLVRAEQHENAAAAQQNQRKQADVTARWLGYDKNGRGLAEYEGEVFTCEVISNTCKQKYAQINLRRTKRGNFCDWQ